jgi:predicted RNA methylase
MYNTKVVCTYNTPDVFSVDDNITEEEKGFVRDALYRQELSNILGIEDFEDSEMEKTIHELYKKTIENPFLKECMIKLSGQFMTIDCEFGLMIMFSYDYMYLTHICVSELLDTGIISEKNIEKLRSIIF